MNNSKINSMASKIKGYFDKYETNKDSKVLSKVHVYTPKAMKRGYSELLSCESKKNIEYENNEDNSFDEINRLNDKIGRICSQNMKYIYEKLLLPLGVDQYLIYEYNKYAPKENDFYHKIGAKRLPLDCNQKDSKEVFSNNEDNTLEELLTKNITYSNIASKVYQALAISKREEIAGNVSMTDSRFKAAISRVEKMLKSASDINNSKTLGSYISEYYDKSTKLNDKQKEDILNEFSKKIKEHEPDFKDIDMKEFAQLYDYESNKSLMYHMKGTSTEILLKEHIKTLNSGIRSEAKIYLESDETTAKYNSVVNIRLNNYINTVSVHMNEEYLKDILSNLPFENNVKADKIFNYKYECNHIEYPLTRPLTEGDKKVLTRTINSMNEEDRLSYSQENMLKELSFISNFDSEIKSNSYKDKYQRFKYIDEALNESNLKHNKEPDLFEELENLNYSEEQIIDKTAKNQNYNYTRSIVDNNEITI